MDCDQATSDSVLGNTLDSSWRDRMLSLLYTLRRWNSTVRGLRNSRAPMSGFDRPSRASCAICFSCGVRSSRATRARRPRDPARGDPGADAGEIRTEKDVDPRVDHERVALLRCGLANRPEPFRVPVEIAQAASAVVGVLEVAAGGPRILQRSDQLGRFL